MSFPVRCPYCVEDDNFRLMKSRPEQRWFVCESCGHAVMPDNPNFRCYCQKCGELSRHGEMVVAQLSHYRRNLGRDGVAESVN